MLSTNALLCRLQADDLISIRNQTCRLTQAGLSHLRREGSARLQENTFAKQHRHTVNETVTLNGERHTVYRNLNESPLSRLKVQKCKDGSPWLSDAAFSAGERLRQDFTHA